MPYKLVMFDFDGTLADSFPWFSRVFNELAGEFNFRKLTREDQERLRHCDSREIMRTLGMPLWRVPMVMKKMRELGARDIEQIPLFPGVRETLARLKKHGLKLSVVSSNSAQNVQNVLRSDAGLIDEYACGASMFGKRLKMRNVMKLQHCTAEESIYIGDEIRDAEASDSLGVDFGAVTWGYTSREALAARKPRHLFDTPQHIMKITET